MFSSAEIRKAVDKIFLGYKGNSFRVNDVVFLALQFLGVEPSNYYFHQQAIRQYLTRSDARAGKYAISNGYVKVRG